jgi:hypothetical protein
MGRENNVAVTSAKEENLGKAFVFFLGVVCVFSCVLLCVRLCSWEDKKIERGRRLEEEGAARCSSNNYFLLT